MAERATSLAFQPQPSDVLIAVMGITGSGKSTFISHCTDKNVSIGEGLHSDTQDIVPYPCKPDIGANVYLIDTPGFDDTERDDAEILRQIATWVGDTYKKKVHIRGILYLHRITDVRMQGAAIRNLFMFKKLCGKDALQNVILVTTMWGEVRHNVGIQREDELRTKPGYWGEMISRGSRMARHHNHDESARNIIHTLLDTTTRTTLAIQTEMVDENKDLHDTSAGKELDSILTLERERFARDIEQLKQDMAEARELQDKESQDQIQQLQKQRQDEIANLLHQQESLKVSLEQLHEERFAKLEQLLTTQQSQMEKDRLKIAELREQLAKASLVKNPDLTHSSSNLDASTYRCVHNLEGHTSEVNSVFFSPDSECLASGSGDHTIKIFDSKLGRCLQTLEGHSRSVSSIAYSPDGRHIASASRLQKGTINIWDSRSGRSLQRLEDEDGAVFSLVYSPDGRRIVSATGSSDNTAKVWESSTGRCLQILKGHSDSVSPVAYSPDGRCIASGSSDKTVKIWHSSIGCCLHTFDGHMGAVWSVAYSPDGRYIASGSQDNAIKICDSNTMRYLQTLEGHSGTVYSVAYSPDGRCIASGSRDGTVKIWNTSTGRCIQTLEGHQGWVFSVAYSPDGRLMASGSADKTVKIWRTQLSV